MHNRSSLLFQLFHIYLWYWVISVHFAERDVWETLSRMAQMDHVRCADLHNEIVRLGIEGTGETFNPEALQLFWDTVPEHHEQLEQQMKWSIIEFYKRALVYNRQYESESSYQNFFYFVSELNNPLHEGYYRDTLEGENQDAREREDDPDRYLLFYTATNLESHAMGIV